MRMLSSASQWPPLYTQELATALSSVPQFPERRHNKDADYTLVLAMAELAEWLPGLPDDKPSSADRKSLADDVGVAVESRGHRVRVCTPAADALVSELEQFALAPNSKVLNPAVALSRLRDLQKQLGEPEAVVAAFDDLKDAIEDGASTPRMIQSRLALLTGALELAGHMAAQVCKFVAEIVDDQRREIDLARHIVDGSPFAEPDKVDSSAGLPIADRLDLARRYLLRPSEPGHHVVWLAFERAHLQRDWRETVGPVEFFNGPTLVEKMMRASKSDLPSEFTVSPGQGFEWDRIWPKDDVNLWVAVRVDLGIGSLSDAVGRATDLVNAVVQLARFSRGESTWTLLEGHLYLLDGRWRTATRFGHGLPEQDLKARQDSTAVQFERLSASIQPHMSMTNPRLRRLLVVLRNINDSASSEQPDLLLNDVRAIEFISGLCGGNEWTAFLIEHTSVSHAWNRAVQELFNAVHAVFWDHTLELEVDRHDFLDRIETHSPDGTVTRDYAAAFDLVDYVSQGAPLHHATLRRLRDVSRHIQSQATIEAWINELEDDYQRRVARTRRLRNGMTHSGAAHVDLLRTVRILINNKARNLARLTLEAVLTEGSVSESIAAWRDEFEDWKAEIAAAPHPRHALVGKVGERPDSESENQSADTL